nr:hypothetical protein L204_01993 [Cryptococcus depauperatus CBS 7855]
MASPLEKKATDATTTYTHTSMPSDFTRPTSGPLYDPLSGLTCLGIATHDGADWFTTTLCALLGANPTKVNASIHLDEGTYNNAENATFSVHDLDGKANPVPVSFLNGGGAGIVNSGSNAWFAGGFRSAIVSTGGSGVVDGQLFQRVGSSDDKLVAAGEWGFSILPVWTQRRKTSPRTAIIGVCLQARKVWRLMKSVDDWMDKAYKNPVIILTNDKTTAKGLEPNQYYTVYLTKNEDKTISVWHTTTDPNDLLNVFIKVDSKELKENTRYLYHLKGWAAY